MSIGSFGGIQGSAAGAPLSQTSGSETEKLQQQARAAQRQTDAADKADKAAGIGTTEEDQQASDRDADGRRMYDDHAAAPQANSDQEKACTIQKSKDPTGQAGNQLDLMG